MSSFLMQFKILLTTCFFTPHGSFVPYFKSILQHHPAAAWGPLGDGPVIQRASITITPGIHCYRGNPIKECFPSIKELTPGITTPLHATVI